ncbi:DnaJ domain-containing protein [Azospirillum sp.]|uniref:DnaJ domain-containing protein n=1 Tax=Azospirillum sp. TaxID=34012 RepID=UPI003D734CCE
MMPLALAAVALAVGLWLLARAFVAASPQTLARGLRYGGIGLGAAVVLFAALRGQLGTVLALGAMLAPLLIRHRRRREAAARAEPSSGQASRVETLYLRMTLDHDTGAMAGEVLYGPLKGRTLDSLDPAEASALLNACRQDDPQSAAVLEAWLDRARPDWRERFAETEMPAGGGSGTMSREEAYEVLGLMPGASAEQVKEAHRRLMMGVHPDHGGSTYLAAKINQAKDLLLRH